MVIKIPSRLPAISRKPRFVPQGYFDRESLIKRSTPSNPQTTARLSREYRHLRSECPETPGLILLRQYAGIITLEHLAHYYQIAQKEVPDWLTHERIQQAIKNIQDGTNPQEFSGLVLRADALSKQIMPEGSPEKRAGWVLVYLALQDGLPKT